MIIYDLNSKRPPILHFPVSHETQGMDWLSAPAEIGDPNYQALFGHKKGIVTKLMLAAGWNMLNVLNMLNYILFIYILYIYMYVFIFIYMKC